jgi:hypothetical protein
MGGGGCGWDMVKQLIYCSRAWTAWLGALQPLQIGQQLAKKKTRKKQNCCF